MSLEEIISKELSVAAENQKVVDTHILFDDISIEELYADDTEVIDNALINYQAVADYHRQIAELLIAYKELKDGKDL